MLSLGETVDRYKVETVIGTGGTAVVYRVRHRSLDTLHALKVLTISSSAIRTRMLQEGKVQASLRHPNVVAVYDVLEIDNAPGLLMEYIDGPSLERALIRHRFGIEEGETLFRGILSGVHEAHQFGLVHRDLKPANVLLKREGNQIVPKVTDFGIAKVINADDHSTNTRSGVAMGTPQYMAPEQIRDARTVDHRADLFSLGCLLYEILSGERAFPHDDTLATYQAIAQGSITDPKNLVPDLPHRFSNAIAGCIVVNRDKRIPDCETLERVISGVSWWDVNEAVERPTGNGNNVDVHSLEDGTTLELDPLTDDLLQSDMFTTAEPSPTLGMEGSLVSIADESEHSSSRSMLWFALAFLLFGAFMLAGVTTIAQWALSNGTVTSSRSQPAPDEPSIETEPASAGAGAPTEVNPAPESPATEAPVVPHRDVAPKPAVRPSPAPTAAPVPKPRIASAPEPVVAPAPAPELQTPSADAPIEVKLLSKPPTADVWVDGKSEGKTPKKLMLAPGTHQVKMKLSGQEKTFPIRVAPGDGDKWCFVFGEEMVYHGKCPR